jgi:3-oxoacid CoA-transferase
MLSRRLTPRAGLPVFYVVRAYTVPANSQVPRRKKVWNSLDEAVSTVKSGDVLLSGGFGLCGTPDTLIGALAARADVRNLTAVSNNAGSGLYGLGARPVSTLLHLSLSVTVRRKAAPLRTD